MKYRLTVLSLCLGLLCTACASQMTSPPTAQEVAAVTALAKRVARQYGMEGEPTKIVVKRTALSEWFSLTGMSVGPDAVRFGLNPDRRVYIVAMLCTGIWRGPGDPTGDVPRSKFDGLKFVFAADTLAEIGAGGVAPDELEPLGLVSGN